MLVMKKIIVYTLVSLLVLILNQSAAFSEEDILEQSLPSDTIVKELPSDMIIEEMYEPGSGLPAGKIQSLRGSAVIFHQVPDVRFRAKVGLPLYLGDTIITRENARIQCRLIDGAKFMLVPDTTLTILQSAYSSARKASISFLSLRHGGARFQLKAQPEFSSEFKVQTNTFFIVTQEADCIIQSTNEKSEIIALDESRLEVTSPTDPEGAIYLSDYQRIIVENQFLSPIVETLLREEAESITADFRLLPDGKLFSSSADRYREGNETDVATKNETMPLYDFKEN
ncbi:MAG: FecR domain-containing protein [Desulfobacterales bacterium]|jgi:hypothetical protein